MISERISETMPTIDRAAANDKLGRQVKLKDQLREQNKKLKAENEKLKVKLSNTMMDTGRLAETIWEKDEEIKKLKEEMASSQCWCAEAEHWRDELMKVFKSFEETDDVTPEDIDPEFVGAWISDALKRDQQIKKLKEEIEGY